MATTANRGAGALSRFAHFAGITKPKADEEVPTTEEHNELEDKVETVEDKVEDLEDRVDDVEETVEDEPKDDDEPPADKPEARAAYRKGRANGRKVERARAGAILAAPVAAANRNLALHLAFEGDLPAKQAVALLKASAAGTPKVAARQQAAAPQGGKLDARMSASKPVNLGSGGDEGKPNMETADGVAAHVLAIAKRAGVLK